MLVRLAVTDAVERFKQEEHSLAMSLKQILVLRDEERNAWRAQLESAHAYTRQLEAQLQESHRIRNQGLQTATPLVTPASPPSWPWLVVVVVPTARPPRRRPRPRSRRRRRRRHLRGSRLSRTRCSRCRRRLARAQPLTTQAESRGWWRGLRRSWSVSRAGIRRSGSTRCPASAKSPRVSAARVPTFPGVNLRHALTRSRAPTARRRPSVRRPSARRACAWRRWA